MRLQGKVALITGAAMGDKEGLMGIGGAAAWLFVRECAKVVVTDIDDALGEKTVAQIHETGGDAIYLHLDVREEAEWVNAINATVDKYGRLDILVNSAGTVAPGRVEDTTVETWDDQMDVHVKAVFLGTTDLCMDI